MTSTNATALTEKSCKPCEGGVAPVSQQEAQSQLQELNGWELQASGKEIERKWQVRDFMAGVEFLNRVAAVAEKEGHHPDVHLTGYRDVAIKLTTHAIGGLSENDFILAAKIDELPIKLKD